VALRKGSTALGAVAERALTDESGNFIFAEVPAGVWSLVAGKVGYQSSAAIDQFIEVTLAEGGRATNQIIRLNRFGWLQGTVEDEFGDRVPYVPVRAVVRQSHGRWQPGPVTRTDDRGMFRLSELKAGEYKVAAVFSTIASKPEASEGTPVTGETSLAIAGSAVRLQPEYGPVRIDAAGRTLVYPTTFASGTSTLDGSTTFTLGWGQNRSGLIVRVRALPAGRVNGRLRLDGIPELPAGLTVRLVRPDLDGIQPEWTVATAEIAGDGRFVFPAVAPATYQVRVLKTPPASASRVTATPAVITTSSETVTGARDATSGKTDTTIWGTEDITVAEGETSEIVLALQAGATVAGRIVLEGDSVAAAQFTSDYTVQFLPFTGSQGPYLPARPNPDLSFKSPPLPRGKYVLYYPVQAPWSLKSAILKGVDISDEPTEIGASDLDGLVITLTTRAPALSGEVRDTTGQLRAGAPVLLFSADRRHWMPVTRRVRLARSSPSGMYRFDGVPEGEYIVVALMQEPTELWKDPETLSKLAQVGRRVALRTGAAVVNLDAVRGTFSSEAPERSTSVALCTHETAASGPSDLALRCFEDSQDSQQQQATLTGRIINRESGQPIRSAIVSVLDSSGLSKTQATLSRDDGTFRFEGLREGAYRLTASKPSFVDSEFGATAPGRPGLSVVLRAGERRELTLSMSRGAAVSGVVRASNGELLPGVLIRVMVRRLASGRYKLVPARGAQEIVTDETGAYRAFGLLPGEYVIGATAANITAGTPARPPSRDERTGPAGANELRGSRPVVSAPAFFPSATSAADATPVTLAANEERSGIDITLPQRTTFQLSGSITSPSQSAAGIRVTLAPDDAYIPGGQVIGAAGTGEASSRGGIVNVNASKKSNGFAIDGLTPGTYTVFARQSADGKEFWAQAAITISDSDMSLTLRLEAPISISGRAVFEGASTSVDQTVSFRLEAVDTTVGINPAPIALKPGTFSLSNVLPGRYRIASPERPGRWALRSATLNSDELLDRGLTVPASGQIDEVALFFTSTPSELTGTFSDAKGQPATDFYVIVFPTESQFWQEGSRRIIAVRPASNGAYLIRNLPPGQYHLAAVSDVAQDEWFTRAFLEALRPFSMEVTIRAGEATRHDIRASR
jgi:uncharacterized protein (DUF2141 family)